MAPALSSRRARLAALLLAALLALGAVSGCGLGFGSGEGARGGGGGDGDGAPAVTEFRVSFSGDLLMHQPLLARALANDGGGRYDFAPFFKEIAPWVKAPELAVCHLETPMGPGPPSSYPIFNTPTDLARSIRKAGWDACTTASNHSLDQGMAGIEGTVKALDKRGIAHTGSFASAEARDEPVIVSVGDVKIGLIAYPDATNGIPLPTPWAVNTYPAENPKAGAKAILADARRAREAGADAVVVNVHWGAEYALEPSPFQRELAERLTGSDLIDAVVGQGPHVVQPIERVNGKFVVFSEGNLVSNQSAAAGLPAHTQDGLIALLHFRARGDEVRVRRVEYVPVWVRPGDYVVLPATPDADPGNAEALRASFERTTAVAGKGKGVKVANFSAP